MWCVTPSQVSFDSLLLEIANKNASADTEVKYQVIWKDVDVVSELCITCASTWRYAAIL